MLDKLNNIDWDSLDASSVPGWLRSFTSNSRTERFRASMDMLQYLGHNDLALNLTDRYIELLSTDVTIIITPFLLDLLMSPKTHEKSFILEMLAVLASYKSIPILTEVAQKRSEWIYQHLLENFDKYQLFIESSDAKTREQATFLLGDFDERTVQTLDLLLTHLEDGELEEDVQLAMSDTIHDCLSKLTQKESAEPIKRFSEILNSWIKSPITSISVQATASYFLILLDSHNVQNQVVKVLLNSMKIHNMHLLSLPLFDDCIDALLSLGMSRGTNALLDIFESQTNSVIIIRIATVLLSIHFGNGKFKEMRIENIYTKPNKVYVDSKTFVNVRESRLSKTQKIILSYFVYNEAIWKINTNLFNVFNLPNSQDKLRKLITL